MGASCPSPALHCNYCSINTTGISDVCYARVSLAKEELPSLPTWWMCPGTCCSSLSRGKRCFCCARLCAKGNGQIPQMTSHPCLLPDCPLGTGMSLPGPGEGAARCSSLPWGQCDQPCQAGSSSIASRQDRFIGRRPQQEWLCRRPLLPQK